MQVLRPRRPSLERNVAKRGGPGRCEGISLAEIMRCPPTTCTLDGHLRVNRRKEQKEWSGSGCPWPLDLGPQLLRAVTVAVEDLPRTARGSRLRARGRSAGRPVGLSATDRTRCVERHPSYLHRRQTCVQYVQVTRPSLIGAPD